MHKKGRSTAVISSYLFLSTFAFLLCYATCIKCLLFHSDA